MHLYAWLFIVVDNKAIDQKEGLRKPKSITGLTNVANFDLRTLYIFKLGIFQIFLKKLDVSFS